jgi:hypothetical protein
VCSWLCACPLLQVRIQAQALPAHCILHLCRLPRANISDKRQVLCARCFCRCCAYALKAMRREVRTVSQDGVPPLLKTPVVQALCLPPAGLGTLGPSCIPTPTSFLAPPRNWRTIATHSGAMCRLPGTQRLSTLTPCSVRTQGLRKREVWTRHAACNLQAPEQAKERLSVTPAPGRALAHQVLVWAPTVTVPNCVQEHLQAVCACERV